MKKLMNVFVIAAAFTMITVSCKNGGAVSSDPKAVLVAFFERMSKKDIDGAAKLATKESKTTMDMMKKGMEMAEKMKDQMPKDEKDPAEEFKNVEIGEAKINGDAATVAFKNKKQNVSFDFPLKKEDGGWKVDFSMGTLMKMGMDAKNKGMGGGGNDAPMTEENLEKTKAMADSLMKNIDPKKMEEAMKAIEKMKEAQK
jgi:Domain of unknown function (DUF4878)